MPQPYDLTTLFLEKVKAKGGFVNCHAHFDKAFYITEAGLAQAMVDMEVKWRMSDDIKKNSTIEQMADRIRKGLDSMVQQGAQHCVSFVDAYDAVGHRAIDAAIKIKQEYRDKINFLIATQPLGGLVDPTARHLYKNITAQADIAGGLPSMDRPHDSDNLDWLFQIATELNKPIHVHIDQQNNPDEHDIAQLLDYVEKYHYQGRVAAIHGISISAQPKDYRQKIYERMATLEVGLIVCPSAALSMKQLDSKIAPLHNSIANVPEALAAGVTVAIGVDNVRDFYQPMIDGDLYTEARFLMEACRFYDINAVADICTLNGKKICAMK